MVSVAALREAPALSPAEALAIVEEHGSLAAREAIPELLAGLERVRAVLWMRMTAPVIEDRLLEAPDAAILLGVPVSTLYEKADSYEFTVRENRRVKFSALGIQRYLSRRRGDGGRLG